MDAKLGGKAHNFYGPVVSDVKDVGKKNMEWDLNDWKWDGDLFTAAPFNSLPIDCRSRQCFPVASEVPPSIGVPNSLSCGSNEVTLGNEKGKTDLEKRRRTFVAEEEEMNDEDGSLNLKLGRQLYPITEGEMAKWEGKSGKKTKIITPLSNRAVCQVEDCRADLSNAKDYHRRHKVCDVHSKATRALVGNVMQRFCQQCSRFHVLQEFDEGKRSCRRRLAGHNRRRRKTHPENVVSASSQNDEQDTNYLLISLLRILSNIHTNSLDQSKDQDLLSHILRNLVSPAMRVNEKNLSGFLPGSQDLQIVGTSTKTPTKEYGSNDQHGAAPQSHSWGNNLQNPSASGSGLLFPSRVDISGNTLDAAAGRTKLNDIDLNNAYDDSRDSTENLKNTNAPINEGNVSTTCPLWSYQVQQKSSPPQTSGNSASTSSQSPSGSSGEAQSRTDRIVFKLFGKDPSDFPEVLRNQILEWLSHSPTNIESYIRPGCIVLTIYMRMDKSIWKELCCDLSSSLRRLLSLSTDSFWRTGWIYTRVRHHVAFIYNGQVVLNTSLPHKNYRSCRISSIRPVAVSLSERVQFSVKGVNLFQSTTRLQCALEGNYLVQANCAEIMGGADLSIEHNQTQFLSFQCTIPNVIGRGFIEVEDHGLDSSFFPFIVAEKDVCSEICTLESVIEAAENADGIQGAREVSEARGQALYFLHEMGWLLHRNQLKLRLGHSGFRLDLCPLQRFRWLVEFSIDHGWCAVIKKLLDIMFNGIVDAGECASFRLALLEIGLLHRAVRQNSRRLVEFLLSYHHDGVLAKSESEQKQFDGESYYLFRPDATGPGGLTPLHMAASSDGYDDVLDALTDDPGLVGIEAWWTARDNTGSTPNDYAFLRGHYSYIDLVRKRMNKKLGSGHVVLDIPPNLLDNKMKQKLRDGHSPVQVASFHTEKRRHQVPCQECEAKLGYGSSRTSLAMYKPAMLSMVAIAAVCVCVALLFKSSPEVLYVFRPFRWELLDYGSM